VGITFLSRAKHVTFLTFLYDEGAGDPLIAHRLQKGDDRESDQLQTQLNQYLIGGGK